MSAKVYLAGPIRGLSYDGCTEWRDRARLYLANHDILAFSPMRAKQNLADEQVIEDSYRTALSNGKAITARDRFDCQRVDLVLMNLLGASEVSIGSMIELGWADAARRPIVLISEATGNVHDHAIVAEICGFHADSLPEALALVVAILTP